MLKMLVYISYHRGIVADFQDRHSVVQSFCRDSLDARNMLPEWLQHATQLLEQSFHAADSKIKRRNQPARVSDYRYYHVRPSPINRLSSLGDSIFGTLYPNS